MKYVGISFLLIAVKIDYYICQFLFTIMLVSNLNSCNINKILLRFFTTGILAATGFFSILVLEVAPPLSLTPLTAYAQNYTPNEVTNYAKAGYEQELLRLRIHRQIKSILKRTPPNIVCDQPRTYQNLPNNLTSIVQNYCNDSSRIIESHGLTVDRFNQLKRMYDRGGEFRRQVQKVLNEL